MKFSTPGKLELPLRQGVAAGHCFGLIHQNEKSKFQALSMTFYRIKNHTKCEEGISSAGCPVHHLKILRRPQNPKDLLLACLSEDLGASRQSRYLSLLGLVSEALNGRH